MDDQRFRVTRIETQKHDENRASVYLDGVYGFGVDREVLIRHPLHEGDTLSDTEIDGILLSEELQKAKQKALTLLSYRDRSVEELKRALSIKGFQERTVRHVVADFLRVGLLDDRRFASAYAQSRMLMKPVGRRLLKKWLLEKGIGEKIAEQTVDDMVAEGDEEALARNLALKRIGKVRQEGRLKARKKLSEFLMRRGFDWDVISSVLSGLDFEE